MKRFWKNIVKRQRRQPEQPVRTRREELFETIGANRRVVSLISKDISDDDAEIICEILETTRVSVSIRLHWNQIGHRGAKCIANSLRANNFTFRALYLSGNDIGLAGAQAIGECLVTNRALRVLALDNCNIGANGCLDIATGLRDNTSLRGLVLSDNNIGDDGAEILSRALHVNGALFWLFLENNSIGMEGCISLAQGLQYNDSLGVLHLMGNNVGDVGLDALLRTLHQGNETLIHINLSDNNVTTQSEIESRLLFNQYRRNIRRKLLRQQERNAAEQHPGLWPQVLSALANQGMAMGTNAAYFLLQNKPELVQSNFYYEAMELKIRMLLNSDELWPLMLFALFSRFDGKSLVFFLLKQNPALLVARNQPRN